MEAKDAPIQGVNYSGGKASEVAIDYEIKAAAAGNLPLTFTLAAEKGENEPEESKTVSTGEFLSGIGGKEPTLTGRYFRLTGDRQVHACQVKDSVGKAAASVRWFETVSVSETELAGSLTDGVLSGTFGAVSVALYDTDAVGEKGRKDLYGNLFHGYRTHCCQLISVIPVKEGALTLEGAGMSDDFTPDTAPLRDYAGRITRVVIPEGVARLGDCLFYGCYGPTGTLPLPSQRLDLGDGAFSGPEAAGGERRACRGRGARRERRPC